MQTLMDSPTPAIAYYVFNFLDKSVCNDTLKLVLICIFNFQPKHSFSS